MATSRDVDISEWENVDAREVVGAASVSASSQVAATSSAPYQGKWLHGSSRRAMPQKSAAQQGQGAQPSHMRSPKVYTGAGYIVLMLLLKLLCTKGS